MTDTLRGRAVKIAQGSALSLQLRQIQSFLELGYGAYTGLDVRDFVLSVPGLCELGKLLVEQERDSTDLNIAVLFDRDILAAFESPGISAAPKQRSFTVMIEELSHFTYLAYNHQLGRNVTRLEMELQSEVDRIKVAFLCEGICLSAGERIALLDELYNKPYELVSVASDASDASDVRANEESRLYEESRRIAGDFIRRLSGGDPNAWGPKDLERLRRFFHSDLAEKIHLSRKA